MIDLHIHSYYSDGAFSPTKLVELAQDKGVQALALCDHDTGQGIPEIQQAGKKHAIEILSGIEFSTTWHDRELHLIGYGLDYQHASVQTYLAEKQQRSTERVKKVIEKLEEIGFRIPLEHIKQLQPHTNQLKRVHVLKYLLTEPMNKSLLNQYLRHQPWSVDAAWEALMVPGTPGFVPICETLPSEIIPIIHRTGGLACLAHPGLTVWENLEKNLSELVQLGLDGIECLYSLHTPEQTKIFLHLAKKFSLLVTGGTDFHGGNVHPGIEIGIGRGDLSIPYTYFANIQKTLKNKSNT